MRRHWKRLAKSASNAACDDRERTEALTGALQGDWRVEVPEGFIRRFRDILDDHQGDLFGESVTGRLEALRRETADRPPGRHRAGLRDPGATRRVPRRGSTCQGSR